MTARREGRFDLPRKTRHRYPRPVDIDGPRPSFGKTAARQALETPPRRPFLFLAPILCGLVLAVGLSLSLSPNHRLFALGGILAGLVLGLGLSVGVDRLNPTITSAEQLRSVLPLPVLAVLSYATLSDQRRWAASSDVVGDDTAPLRLVEAGQDRGRHLPYRRAGGRGVAVR
jgi:hypothetical protein